GTNPARRIEQFREHRRERFLTGEELVRLGTAIREAETKGLPWDGDKAKPEAKHLPKAKNRFTKIGPFAAAAIRLLLFTGSRLREILHLRWEQVDLERGLLFLAASKTGTKTVILKRPCACGTERPRSARLIRRSGRRPREASRRSETSLGGGCEACRALRRAPARPPAHLCELRCRRGAWLAQHPRRVWA